MKIYLSPLNLFALVFTLIYSIVCNASSDSIKDEQSTMHKVKILVYGDSLSAAYGIPLEKGWVALLRDQLEHRFGNVEVINASISGETTSGGLSRFASTLDNQRPDIVLLELGANDGLQGQSLDIMRNNLEQMIKMGKHTNAVVLLLGMEIPPNYGPIYTAQFRKSFSTLASTYQLPFVPFFLAGVADKAELKLEDGLHPNTEAQPIIVQNISPDLIKDISEIHSSHSGAK